MVNIVDVTILSIDKNDDSWEIEGEILFEGDLGSEFSATYYPWEDELEALELGIVPGRYDKGLLKEMIIESSSSFDD